MGALGLTFKLDTATGEWRASLGHHFHGVGWSKDVAVNNLGCFLQRDYPQVLDQNRDVLDAYFAPKKEG